MACSVPKNEKNIRLGNFINRPRGFNAVNIPGGQVALFIPNTLKEPAIIKQLRFYMGEKGNFKKPFAVQLYTANKQTNAPDSALLMNNIGVSNVEVNGWHSVYISNEKIVFPDAGVFAAMIWLPDAKNIENETYNCQYLAYSKANGKLQTWYHGLQDNWYQLPETDYNAMIAIDLEIIQ